MAAAMWMLDEVMGFLQTGERGQPFREPPMAVQCAIPPRVQRSETRQAGPSGENPRGNGNPRGFWLAPGACALQLPHPSPNPNPVKPHRRSASEEFTRPR